MGIPTGIICHTTQGTVGTTATAVGSVTTADWFRVEAAPGNSGKIYLGGSGMGTAAAANGYFVALAAGTEGMNAGYDVKAPGGQTALGTNGKVFDLSKWYVAGSGAGQVYNVTYFSRINDG